MDNSGVMEICSVIVNGVGYRGLLFGVYEVREKDRYGF